MDYRIKGETLSDMANAIRSKTGGADPLKPSEMPAAIENVYDAGQQSEWNTFWDAYQKNGTRSNYQMAFAYGWTNDSFKPKYDIVATGGATSIFQYIGFEGDMAQRFEDCGVRLDLSKATSAHSVFNSATAITRVPEINITGAGTAATGVFAYCGKLVTIEKFVVAETNIFTSTFINCFKLVNLTIEGVIAASIDLKSCPLSKDSILSVFNALSTGVTGQTATFKKTAVDAAFETSEGANDGSTSAEWISMVDKESPTAIRPNWTIALA